MTGEWPALYSQQSMARVSPVGALEPARTTAMALEPLSWLVRPVLLCSQSCTKATLEASRAFF